MTPWAFSKWKKDYKKKVNEINEMKKKEKWKRKWKNLNVKKQLKRK